MTAVNPYPQRNPFPHQGALSIEGTSIGMEAEVPGIQQPTLMLDPILELGKKTRQYLDRFRPNIQGQGQMVVLSGDHGSGKTHAIRYLMGEVADDRLRRHGESEPPLQLYAKAEGPSFLTVYKQLSSQIPMPLLRELSLRFFGVLAGRQIGRDLKDPEVGRQEAESLRREPHKVFDLFSTYLVEEGAVQELQIKEVERVAGGIDDFKRALSYLLSDDLCTHAYNWLTGQQVGANYLRKLGVSGEIASDDVAKWGLQLLATIFNRGGRPLIIYLDQYEKLVLDRQGALISQNAGLLHSLVEVIPRENGMLVIAGNREAWAALARDLKDRFAFNVIEFPVLKPEEAIKVVFIYLRGASAYAPTATPDESDLFPFTVAAVMKIVSYSGGNLRRLLQSCSAAFDEAHPDRRVVDEGLVEETIRRSPRIYFDSDSVKAEIRALFNERGLSFKESFPVQDKTVDFGVVDAQQTPRLLIKLRRAMFYDSEAREALEELNLVERIRQEGWPATCAFVVLGYVSPEISGTMRQFAPEYVVYNPETFRQSFEPILARTREAIAAARQEAVTAVGAQPGQTNIAVKVDPVPSAELEIIKAELQKLHATRAAEAQSVQDQLNLFLQTQATEKLNERRQAGRLAWAEERRKIEEQIREAREKRRQAEFEELQRLRAKAEETPRPYLNRKYVLAFIVYVSVFLLMLGVPFFWRWGMTETFKENWLTVSILVSFVMTLPFLLRAFNPPIPSDERELRSAMGSLKELDQLARALANERSHFPLTYLLTDRNPQLRYLGALMADCEYYREELLTALRAERSAFVRRAIAKKLGSCLLYANEKDLDRNQILRMAESIPEVAYVIEPLFLRMQDPYLFGVLPHELNTLGLIVLGKAEYNFFGMLPGRVQDRAVIADLVKAFERGLERHAPLSLAEISDFSLREASRELSPFEEGGLGAFDELQSISLIDQLYLFFHQLRFYLERDLIGQTTPSELSQTSSSSLQSIVDQPEDYR